MAEQDGQSEEHEKHEKAEEAKEKHDQAQAKMKELEDKDDLPSNLEEWPSDEAKYVTYGGAEGDHSYDEGPEEKLGPTLEHLPGGGVKIEGEEVDDPEKYKGDPIPGGPTDPDTPETHGERRKRAKMERMYGKDDPSVKAANEAAEERGDVVADESGDSGDSGDSEKS